MEAGDGAGAGQKGTAFGDKDKAELELKPKLKPELEPTPEMDPELDLESAPEPDLEP